MYGKKFDGKIILSEIVCSYNKMGAIKEECVYDD
jgi:hypothetical protein